MRKVLVLAAVVAAVSAGAAVPANAAGDTTLTVALVGGSLSISAPSTASLSGSANAGTVITGNLGASATQVTDNRGTLLGWTVSASTDGDLVSTSAPTRKIALTPGASPLTIVAGAVTTSGGLLSGVSAGAGGGLSTTAVPLVAALAGSGGGTYSYTPALTLTVPPNTYAHNDYKVVITQTLT